jgi:hypothetical protein
LRRGYRSERTRGDAVSSADDIVFQRLSSHPQDRLFAMGKDHLDQSLSSQSGKFKVVDMRIDFH